MKLSIHKELKKVSEKFQIYFYLWIMENNKKQIKAETNYMGMNMKIYSYHSHLPLILGGFYSIESALKNAAAPTIMIGFTNLKATIILLVTQIRSCCV